MANTKTAYFKFVSLAIIGALFISIAPTWAVRYTPSITVLGNEKPGSAMTVTGKGFAPNERVRLTMDDMVIAQETVDSQGSFSVVTTVPFVPSDTYEVYAMGQTSFALAKAYFYVGSFYPTVSASEYYVLPGQTLTFSGEGFALNETVKIYEDTSRTEVGSFTANSMGMFTNVGAVKIPFAWAGTNRIFRFVGQSSKGSAQVVVTVGQLNSLVSPSSYYIKPAETITFSGNGFGSSETIQFTQGQDATVLATAQADADGNFANDAAFKIPVSWTSSNRTIKFLGTSSGVSGSFEITVAGLSPQVTPDAWYVPSGTILRFVGTGFAPGEIVFIKSGSEELATVTADANGAFPEAYIPTSYGDDRQITYTFVGTESKAKTDVTITLAGLRPYISLDNYYVTPGTNVLVEGHGFSGGEYVTISLGSVTAKAQANTLGDVAPTAIVVPFGSATSTLMVTMTGDDSKVVGTTNLTLAPFYPYVEPSTWYAPAGTSVTFTGSGFAPGEMVSAVVNGTKVGETPTDSEGALSIVLAIPFKTTSPATFIFTGMTSNAQNSVPITIAPFYTGLELSTYYAVGGSPVMVMGTGFASNETVAIQFGEKTIGPATADANGNFSWQTTVPYLTSGEKLVKATGDTSGTSASLTFSYPIIYVSAQLGAYAGAPGTKINFIGNGYIAGEPIIITTDRTTSSAHSFTADASDSFNDSGFTIPSDFTEGPLKLTIKGEHSMMPITIEYYVTGG